jgi:hypothetical protein
VGVSSTTTPDDDLKVSLETALIALRAITIERLSVMSEFFMAVLFICASWRMSVGQKVVLKL